MAPSLGSSFMALGSSFMALGSLEMGDCQLVGVNSPRPLPRSAKECPGSSATSRRMLAPGLPPVEAVFASLGRCCWSRDALTGQHQDEPVALPRTEAFGHLSHSLSTAILRNIEAGKSPTRPAQAWGQATHKVTVCQACSSENGSRHPYMCLKPTGQPIGDL